MKTLTMNEWREIFKKQMGEVKSSDVWRLKMDWQLDFNHFSPGWVQVLQDQAHARFTCSQCYHSWFSYRVVILFHMNWEQKERRGAVSLKPFRQQCHECSSEKHEVPQFTEEDVTSIIRHLILDIREKCYGEYVDRSELSEVVWDREDKGPHKRQHCEACQMGLHREHHGKSADQHGQPQGAMHYGKPQLPSDLNFWTISMESNQCPPMHSSSAEGQALPVTEPSDLNFWIINMENNQCATTHSSSAEGQAPPVTEPSDPTVSCGRWKCARWKCVLLTSAAAVLFVSVVLILIAYWLNWI